jgi:hypothetical protein
VPYIGPHAGQGWRNSATGEVRYQEEMPEDTGGGERHTILSSIQGAITDHPHLAPEQQAEFHSAAARVVGRMNHAAIQRFAKHVKGYAFHRDTQHVTDAVLAQNPAVAAKMLSGTRISGAFDRKRGVLHLDGPQVALEGKRQSTEHVYAHEFTHAVDGPGKEISNSPAWQEAWKAELAQGGLSKYARTSASEGLAEFGRLLWAAGDKGKTAAQLHFPRCAKVWKEHGLW